MKKGGIFFMLLFLVSCGTLWRPSEPTIVPVDTAIIEQIQNEEELEKQAKEQFENEVRRLGEEDCIEVQINETDTCPVSDFTTFTECISGKEMLYPPLCIQQAVSHIDTPEEVKSVYFTAYSIASNEKREYLQTLVKNKEINSVTIDIKTVSGYTSFEFSDDYFSSIFPESDGTISDITTIIEELHDAGIYVIGRIVVFKDKRLAELRPDLAIKWSYDHSQVWTDYQGKKYLDPHGEEVWQYIKGLSLAAYDMGFDEINYDYIRYPSDGKVSQTYYPFSDEYLQENLTWGKIMTIDVFSHFITSELKSERPDIQISADIFGLVTNVDLFQIGQNLESFLLYYDYVGPMVYPSHYAYNYLGLGSPDNHPYEVLKDAFSHTNTRIDALNTEIEIAKLENRGVLIKDAFYAKVDIEDLTSIPKTRIRPWLQGFSCTRCQDYEPYTRNKFRLQIEAIEDSGLNSWWVWNSASNYYYDWYNAE